MEGLEVHHEGVHTGGAPGHPHAAGEGGGDERPCAERRLECLQQALSVQLCYMLALLTKNPALDKVQAAGEGEGLGAWRGLH